MSLFGLDLAVLIGGGALLDLPVIMATVIYRAFFITIANALVDIVYARLDPRIRPS